MELDLPDFLGSSGPFWCECGCGCHKGACSTWACVATGLVLGTEIGLAIEDCDGVQLEVSP